MAPRAAAFAAIWLSRLGERSAQMVCDERLVNCAQDHAIYLDRRRDDELLQSMHVGRATSGTGRRSNQRVLAAGYRLPYYFEPDRNNVESCARTSGDAARAVDILPASPPHRAHLMGLGAYAGHTVYGIGSVNEYFVVVICPPVE